MEKLEKVEEAKKTTKQAVEEAIVAPKDTKTKWKEPSLGELYPYLEQVTQRKLDKG